MLHHRSTLHRASAAALAEPGNALERAVPAGVRIAFGTDAGISMHGRNAGEFELLVAHGMTPSTTTRSST